VGKLSFNEAMSLLGEGGKVRELDKMESGMYLRLIPAKESQSGRAVIGLFSQDRYLGLWVPTAKDVESTNWMAFEEIVRAVCLTRKGPNGQYVGKRVHYVTDPKVDHFYGESPRVLCADIADVHPDYTVALFLVRPDGSTTARSRVAYSSAYEPGCWSHIQP